MVNENIDRLQDLAARLPTLNIVESATGDQIFLRGIGSAVNPGFEQSVATFVDGVYKGRDAQSRGKFLDVERIEVLRGPQSIFFGQNTIAGALNIATRGPGDRFEGYVRGLYGFKDQDYEVTAAAGGPLSNTFGVRVAVRAAGRDGFIYNETRDRNEDQQDSIAGRITAAWDPVGGLDAELKLEYSDFDQRGTPKEIVSCPPPLPFTRGGLTCRNTLTLRDMGAIEFDDVLNGISHRGSVPFPGDPIVDASARKALDDFVDIQAYTAGLTVNYDLSGANTLTSVTAFTGYDLDRGTDIDNLPLAAAGINDPSKFDQFSQELRVASPTGGTIEYIFGAYYQKGDFFSDEIFVFPRALNIQSYTLFDQSEETKSAFGAITWNVSDPLRISAGLRYSNVQKDLVFTQVLSRVSDGNPRTASAVAALDGLAGFGKFNVPRSTFSRTDDDFMPSVDVQYDLTNRATVYAKFAQGFKAGGFDQRADNARTLEQISFAPEEVDAYEIGAKTSWFGRRLELNVALFRSDYSNLQVSSLSPSGVSFIVTNAGAARSQGVEVDGRWAVTDDLTLTTAVSYLDAKFTEFENGPCNALEELDRPGCFALPPGRTATADRSGDNVPYAPEYSGSVSLDYDTDLSQSLAINGGVTVYFSTKVFHRIDNDPRLIEDGFAKVDARIGLAGVQGWEFSVIGKNLTNERSANLTNRLVGSSSSYYVQLERDRHVLFQAGYTF